MALGTMYISSVWKPLPLYHSSIHKAIFKRLIHKVPFSGFVVLAYHRLYQIIKLLIVNTQLPSLMQKKEWTTLIMMDGTTVTYTLLQNDVYDLMSEPTVLHV